MKKALCVILTLILCLPSFAAFADIEGTVQGDIMLTSTEGEVAVENSNNALEFSDIVADSVLGEAVYKLVKAKVIQGYPDGTFRPDAGLTRAELCVMINLVFDLDAKAESMSFKDVTKDDWYYDYVLVAVEAGYIKGFTDNTFRGDDPVTREQACAIINRVTKEKGMGLFDLPFTDNITDNVSDWALEDVKKIIASGIMALEEGGKFRAQENIKRAELVLAVEPFAVVLPEYTVKFETNGGSEIASVTVKEGKTVEKPKDPTKKDCTFNGWYTDSKLKNAYNFETLVKGDITLYAKWKANSTGGGGGGGVYIPPSSSSYTVTFDSKGGSQIESVTVTSGSLLTQPEEPTKELKKFTGWYKDSTCTNLYDFSIPVTGNFTLYAGWEDDIVAINEKRLQDIRIFKDVLAELTFDIQPHIDMTNILIETFDDILSGGPYDEFVVDENYIRANYESDMLEIEDIWNNQLFVDDLGDEQQQYKLKMGEAIAQARANGFSMTLSQSYQWFKKIINGIISWD